MNLRKLSDFPFHLDGDSRVLDVRLGEKTLSSAERKALLERVRAGEHIEIDVDAVTYIQREAPNRNHVRFKDGALRTIAKSGVDSVFLRDHAQHKQSERGGTISASQAKKDPETGDWAFHQTFRMVKPWAVEGVLDGTIDRFSIGWHPTGEVLLRHSDEPALDEYGWPKHWPGDELEDGTIVEWVFTKADLVETSAVNVPAVVGTGLKEFRAQLSAHLGGQPPQPEKETVMKKLFKALGLSADAAEDSAVAAVEKLEHDKTAATKRVEALELEIRTEREAHERVKTALAAYEQDAAKRLAAELDAKVAALYEQGKLVRIGGTEPDSLEAHLRDVHAKLGADAFEANASRLSGKVPTERQAGGEDPNPRKTGAASSAFLSDRQRRMVAKMGMSEEQYLANLAKGGY